MNEEAISMKTASLFHFKCNDVEIIIVYISYGR